MKWYIFLSVQQLRQIATLKLRDGTVEPFPVRPLVLDAQQQVRVAVEVDVAHPRRHAGIKVAVGRGRIVLVVFLQVQGNDEERGRRGLLGLPQVHEGRPVEDARLAAVLAHREDHVQSAVEVKVAKDGLTYAGTLGSSRSVAVRCFDVVWMQLKVRLSERPLVLPHLESALGRDEDIRVAVVVQVHKGVGVGSAEGLSRSLAQGGKLWLLRAIPAKDPDSPGVVLVEAEDVGDGVAVALDDQGLGPDVDQVVPLLLDRLLGADEGVRAVLPAVVLPPRHERNKLLVVVPDKARNESMLTRIVNSMLIVNLEVPPILFQGGTKLLYIIVYLAQQRIISL